MKPELLVYGAGKVGRVFAAKLGAAGYVTKLRADRRGLPRRSDAQTLILCVRDARVAPLAQQLAQVDWVLGVRCVLHVSGALSPAVLAPLRRRGTARAPALHVGQLHPMLSIASARKPPSLGGAHALVAGDAAAVRQAKALAAAMGLVPRAWHGVDPALYHAAAALVANGSAALASVGAEVLVASGVDRRHVAQVLGPLLVSVGENLRSLGLPGALTGPVRRGGHAVIAAHLSALRRSVPQAARLYQALARAQLPLARELGEASLNDLKHIERLLGKR